MLVNVSKHAKTFTFGANLNSLLKSYLDIEAIIFLLLLPDIFKYSFEGMIFDYCGKNQELLSSLLQNF